MKKKIEGLLIKHSRSLGCLIFAVFFLVIFSLNLFRLLEPTYRFNSSTGGVVVRTHLTKVYESIKDGEGGSDWAYYPHIQYSYEVNGEKFVGDKYIPRERGETQEIAERILKRFAIGTAVKVFYRSGSPQESVLAFTPTREALGITIFVGVLGALLALLSIFFWRKGST